jgi:ABC-type transporter Mla subunit MlaD
MMIFLAKQKKIFASKKYFYTTINSLEKISTGQELVLRGPNIPIGKITQFSITKRNRVRVDFFVYEEYEDKVRTDSVIIFSAPLFGFLGGFKVELTTGNEYYPRMEANEMVPSSQTREGNFLLMVKGISKQEKDIPLIDKLNPLLENLGKLTDPNGRTIRTLTRLLQHTSSFMMQLSQNGIFSVLGSPQVRSNIERMTAQINTLLSSGDDILNTNVKKLLGDMSQLLNNLKNTTETVNYNLPKLLSQLNSIVFRLERMMANLESSPILGGGGYKQSDRKGTQEFFRGD